MNNKNKKIVIILIVFLLGLAVDRFLLPQKVVTKKEIQYKEVVVTKNNENKTKTKNNNKEIIIVEIKYPDGTIRKEKRILDKGVLRIDSSSTSTSISGVESTKREEKTIVNEKNNWNVSAMASTDFNDLKNVTYGVHIQKRIIGPFNLGGFGFTDKKIGLSLGVQF